MSTRENTVITDGRKSPDAESLRRLQTLTLVLGIASVAWAYLDAIDGPFIWDDLELVKQKCIRSMCSLPEYFRLPFWELHRSTSVVLYRPLTSLSLALDNYLHGQNFAGFHLTNIVFHLVNVGLLAALARRLGANGFIAAFVATIWGMLPRLAESVAWISGRTDILYATPAILALLIWHPESRNRRVVAMALGLVSAFTKEAGICVLIGLGLAEALSVPRRHGVARALVPALGIVGYWVLRQTVVPIVAATPPVPLNLGQRLVTVMEAVGRYGWMSVDLWHPKAQIGVVGEPRLGYAALGLVVFTAAGTLAFRHRQSWDAFRVFVAVVGAMPLLLVAHFIPMPWVTVVGDRLGYLSWGVGLTAVAAWVTRLASAKPFGLRVAIGVGIALAMSLIPSVQRRVHLFADDFAFWMQAVSDTSASNWTPTLNLASLYLRDGLPRESLAIIDSLEKRCPAIGDFGMKAARADADALVRLGDYKQAEQQLLSRSPQRSPELVLALARLRLAQGEANAAELLAQKISALQPDAEEARSFLNTLQRVSRLQVALAGSSDKFSRTTLEAQIAMLSGRLIEAESKWRQLLASRDLAKPTADEAIAFECTFGSAATLPSMVADYANRADAEPSLLRACQDKIKDAERLRSKWQDVNAILVRKNSNANHCHDYGLFFD